MSDEVLGFDHVTLPATARHVQPTGVLDVALDEGACLLLEVSAEQAWPPVAEVASGLLAPAGGRVRIGGADWAGLSADAAAGWRSRIGRVFMEQAWVSNLDVDENVTLARRHHTGQSPAAIAAEADQWARRFGLAGLPATRPAGTARPDLMKAQWVRALLGSPRLLLLERPTRDVPDSDGELLLAAVQEQRERGAAVVWVTGNERALERVALDATVRWRFSGERWEER